ncbi:MAG TPA: lytic polysaccharide monooxygenase [Ktedonobacteraceae bacterium]|nr:lytic polysaccharide monooxygenase [Ktedonobacteraceae bacterium]
MSHRMVRKAGTLVLALLLMVLAVVFVNVRPASAMPQHGAALSPASRTYACFLEDPQNPKTPACQAAIAAGGTQPLYDWFGVLRSDGAGRTSGFIQDGQLCSGGNPKYAAYDAPRADWPATRVAAGTFTIAYAAWVPHPGNFRFYITNSTYDPTKPLTWANLNSTPFLTVDPEPAVANGAYTMTGTLPNMTGRQIIYSVWTRSDSTETFYGCSDVEFGVGGVFPTPTPLPLPTCSATVTITNSWQGGYQASVKIKNTGSLAVIPWLASWNVPTGVTLASGWNANVTQDGTKFLAAAPDWNHTLAAGATADIGFVANGPSSPLPSGVTLNGATCTPG